jgi:hypothetical protein
MKTMKNLSFALLALFITLISCTETERFTANDAQNIENEAATDSFFEDADDISNVALFSDTETAGGKTSGSGSRSIVINDLRFQCATVEITPGANSTPEVPTGTITVTFDGSCSDIRGNVRSGQLVINYNGRRYLPGAVRTFTLVDYRINGIEVEGTRTVTNISGSTDEAPKFRIVLEEGRVTWPDGTFATRTADRTRQWIRQANPINDSWVVTGNAAGVNRRGSSYSMEITQPMEYKRECAVSARVFMAVEGTKVLTIDGERQMTIDYGNGECDREVTITVEGVTRTVTVRGDI